MNERAKAPEDHPDPDRWWRTIKRQSWFCFLSLVGMAAALIRWEIHDAASTPMTVIAIGLVAGAAAYGSGSTLIGFARAWRGQ